MNRKIMALLTTGTLLLTSVTAAGCASKRATLVPTTPATRIHETETQPEIRQPEETMVISPVSHNAEESEPVTFETLTAIALNSKKTTKKSVKKIKKSKTSKKTKKVTKKTAKKTSKKKTVKPAKKTDSIKFTYGHSTYDYKNMSIAVDISKDNSIEFSAVEIHHNDPEIQYEIYWHATGTVDPKTNKASYSNCTKGIIVLTNTGKNVRTHYTGGKGTIEFNGSTLKWNDNHDHAGNNYSFKKN